MEQPLLHPQTRQALESYIAQPGQSAILTGPKGVGKSFIAKYMATRLLGRVTPDFQLENYPHYTYITAEKDKSSIGIDAVRTVQQFIKLRLPTSRGSLPTRRIILIDTAHILTPEAQNALLKMIEEPPRETYFILTADSLHSLLPTVRSRLQQITVHAPALEQTIQAFAAGSNTTAQEIDQAAALSGGLPGLMHAILTNTAHPLKPAVQTARSLLQASQFERLSQVDAMAKSKEATMTVLFVLQHMARAAMAKAAKQGGSTADASIRQWQRIMQAAYDAEQALATSAQSKLTLTVLMLSF